MRKIPKKAFFYFRDFVRILLIVLVFSTIFNFWYINQQRDYFQQYITHSTELRVLTQQVAKLSGEAVVGQQEVTFSDLKSTSDRIIQEIALLKNGEISGNKVLLPPSPDQIKVEDLSNFTASWALMEERIKVILSNQDVIINLDKMSARLVSNIEKIQGIYWDILDLLQDSVELENKSIALIARQISLAEEVKDEIENIVTITNNTADSMKIFSDKSKLFFDNAEKIGDDIQDKNLSDKFAQIEKNIKLVKDDVESVDNVGNITDQIHAAIVDIFKMSPLITNLTRNLENAYINYQKVDTAADLSAYLLGFSSFLILLLSIYLFQKENAFHLRMTEEKNKAMQQEIEKLLKELPEIASGSGNVSLIPSDVSTASGMITESFVYALNTLRKLVYNIGNTAQNVSVAASDAQKITKELAASSSNQAQEIVEVTASVSRMASSIEQVSANAVESASVALESVNIAGEGGKVVRSTISGMERIQTQIQETSNYMRRLSDSSQEIGEIVSLIDGIADQTNILSLNASIQAAMAGEAGRGFAVVADEVQRLAEKVSYATKEIGSLVRSIQTDTSQVIVAMEHTKEQVQEGVNFAQAAGATLEKIETVSRRLSDLIQNISSSASEQAFVSGKISHIMNDVKDIAKQTASGTNTTVDLIGKLMQYVTDLRNSVFELKLPENN